MFSDNIFKIALLISITAHAVLLGPWAALQIPNKLDEKANEIEITYIVPQELLPEPVVHRLPEQYDLKDKELEIRSDGEEGRKTADIGKESYVEEDDAKKIEEYAQYYRLIREKIKKRLFSEYPRGNEKGEIFLVFTIASNGAVSHVRSVPEKSTFDKKLHSIATRSVESCSPFPPFPKSLERESITLNVLVSFQPK